MITPIIISSSVISGFMSCLLFFQALNTKSKDRIKILFWGCLFLASSFSMLEYAFWLEGYNMFYLLFQSFPFLVYFSVWLLFIIWNFEKIGERRIWVLILVLVTLWIIVAINCMNCLKF